MHQMHLTGISNGGMFAYYVATTATDGLGFATINPVAASPLVGKYLVIQAIFNKT